MIVFIKKGFPSAKVMSLRAVCSSISGKKNSKMSIMRSSLILVSSILSKMPLRWSSLNRAMVRGAGMIGLNVAMNRAERNV